MNPSQSTTEETVYGSEATYKQLPDEASTAAGVVPLDTLPAAWWNALWNQQTKQDNNAYADINDLRQEVLSVLSSAPSPITPSATVHNQLYNAIEQIRQIVATVTVAGAVKSSSDIKSVSVAAETGVMLVNALADWSGTQTVKETIDALDSSLSDDVSALSTRMGTAETNISTLQTNVSNLNVGSTTPSATTTTGSGVVGTSTHAARADHQHAIGFDTTAPASLTAITGTSTTGSANAPARRDHTHAVSIRASTTAQTGIVQLNSATNSTSTTQAATASAVNSVRAAVATIKAVISDSTTGTTNTNGRYLNLIWTAPGATSATVLSSVDIGEGGTTNYNSLSNKPLINNIALTGNKTAAQLQLATASAVSQAQSDVATLYVYPKIYSVHGQILTSDSAMRGTGTATVTLFANKTCRIEFSAKITTAGTNASQFNCGLNRNLLKSLNPNIPTITPVEGGVLEWYGTDGIRDNTNLGYAGTLMVSSGQPYWKFSRVYQTSGTIGAYPETECTVGKCYIGTAYGTWA